MNAELWVELIFNSAFIIRRGEAEGVFRCKKKFPRLGLFPYLFPFRSLLKKHYITKKKINKHNLAEQKAKKGLFFR